MLGKSPMQLLGLYDLPLMPPALKLASGDLDCKIMSIFSGTFEPMRSNFNETVDQLSTALVAVSRSTSVIEMGAKEIAQA